MNIHNLAKIRPFAALTLCALLWVNFTTAAEKNPTSKLYIANLKGLSNIDTDGRIEELNEQSVHNAQGTVIETDPDSSNAMVFSNGTGVYLIPDSRMEVDTFRQEPFLPNRTDLDTEPSISQTNMSVSYGGVGICPPRLVAGSSMVFTTPQGSVNVRSGNLVVESDGNETRISLIDGDVTVQGGEADFGGTPLKAGEQAVITRAPDGTTTVTLRPIPEDVRPQIEEWAAQSCMARRSVYFDVDNERNLVNDSVGPEVFNRESASGSGTTTSRGTRFREDTLDVLTVIQLIPTDAPGTTAPVRPVSVARIGG